MIQEYNSKLGWPSSLRQRTSRTTLDVHSPTFLGVSHACVLSPSLWLCYAGIATLRQPESQKRRLLVKAHRVEVLLSGFLVRSKDVELLDISEQFPLRVTINHCLEQHRGDDLQIATGANSLRLTRGGDQGGRHEALCSTCYYWCCPC